MNRDIKVSGVGAWPCDKNRVGLMESFGLTLRELVQPIGRDTEFALGTVWISERQDFSGPVDVFVNLVDVQEHPAFILLLAGARWRSNGLKAVLSSVERKWPAYGWKAENSTVTVFSGEKIELIAGAVRHEKQLRFLKDAGEKWDRERVLEREAERAKRAERVQAEEAQAEQSAQNPRVQPVEACAVEPAVENVEDRPGKPIVSILRRKLGSRSRSAARVAFASDAATLTDVATKDAATMTNENDVSSVESGRAECEKEVAVLRMRVAELEEYVVELWYEQEETRRSLVAIRQRLTDHQ